MLLAGTISLTSIPDMDFHCLLDLSTIILRILVGVELPLCIVAILS